MNTTEAVALTELVNMATDYHCHKEDPSGTHDADNNNAYCSHNSIIKQVRIEQPDESQGSNGRAVREMPHP